MTEIDFTYQQVLEAGRALAADEGAKGWWYSWVLPDAFARQLGAEQARNSPSTSREYGLVSRFDRQVARAANQLAGEGTLIKYGRGQVPPGGRGGRLGNESMFYTPAAHEAALAQAKREADEARALEARWAAIYDALNEAGLNPRAINDLSYRRDWTPRGQALQLDPGDWERLLGLAGDYA